MLIDSQGLLQNLVVMEHLTKQKKATDKFEVVAGGRRLRALRKLAELGKIGQDEEIACMVTTREQALAASTAENSGREPMSMADTVCAFAQMVKDGAGVEEVAVCFGITPLTVRRRLKLTNVSPKLFELFRQEQMNLDQLMALAISDDHEAQERVWDGMHSYDRHATNLRRQLLGREIEASRDPVAKFVGVAAYEAAGGVITRDLFADGDDAGYIADRRVALQTCSRAARCRRGEDQGGGLEVGRKPQQLRTTASVTRMRMRPWGCASRRPRRRPSWQRSRRSSRKRKLRWKHSTRPTRTTSTRRWPLPWRRVSTRPAGRGTRSTPRCGSTRLTCWRSRARW